MTKGARGAVCLMSLCAAGSGFFRFVVSFGAACLRASGCVVEAGSGGSVVVWLPGAGFCGSMRGWLLLNPGVSWGLGPLSVPLGWTT